MSAPATKTTVPPLPPATEVRLRHRVRLLAISLALAAATFLQEPGRIAADTKLDLAVDPLGFLSRSLTLWEPLGFFGQLQNQAYGYLFPVGPFFALGDLLGMPAWVVQRLWWSALLIAAFLGVVRLGRLLGLSSPAAAIAAGLAYALAPRMITEIGVLSVEVLPYAVAPWVLIPLVYATQGRWPARKAAAWSGVALLCAGGVNAVATAVLVPVGALWILTQARGRLRLRLSGWWLLSVALATLWWAIPLLVLGRYSPPFLDWIESSSVTTLITSPDAVVRGASQWVAYVADAGGPVWPGGWLLITSGVLVFTTGLVAASGLTGLALRTTPHRVFLVSLLLSGAVLVSLGHEGPVQGLGASLVRDLLDGVLAPLRNTHKADLLLRLPLALGVGFLAQAALRRAQPDRTRVSEVVGRTTVMALIGAILLGAWPLATGSLVGSRSYAAVPTYWQEAADWLRTNSPDGRALVVPAASFGIYSWGRTQDEPLQPLAQSPWAVRDAVPLSSAGNIRWLDGIEERLESGRGSPGLADALARAGVNYLVVRNDIDQRQTGAPRSVLIRQALVRSGGFSPVAGLGPALPPYRTETTVVDDGLQDTVAAVEIWQVRSPYAPTDPRVTLRSAEEVLVLGGQAESVIALADAGSLSARTVVVAGDDHPLADAGIAMVSGATDGFRRTEVNVGSVRNNRSNTMTATEEFLQDRRVRDYLPVDPQGRQSVAVFDGGVVVASSSGSEATALRGRSAGASPWQAIDGDPATAWVSGDLAPGVGQWWEFVADEPFSADAITVRFLVGDIAGTSPAEVTVTTDAGEITVPVDATDLPQEISVPAGPTRALRLTLAAVDDGTQGEGFGLRDVKIPGLDIPVTRRVEVPAVADGGPIVLQARAGERPGCAAVAGELVCSPTLVSTGEERSGISRVITVAEEGEYRVRVWVRPRPGTALDGLLEPISDTALRAEASSVSTSDPAGRPQAAVDGVLSTAWTASVFDPKPELTVSWAEPREVRGVRVRVQPGLVASRPLSVTAIVNGRETPTVVSSSGMVRFPPQEASSITLRFENTATVRSLDPDTGAVAPLPLGISDITILGAGTVDRGPRLNDEVSVPCGFGPEVSVDGERVLTSTISATVSDVLTDRLIAAQGCDGRLVTLSAGRHLLDVASTEEFAIETVALEPVNAAAPSATTDPVTVVTWDATHREVGIEPSDRPRILETTENANAGWHAVVDGQELEPLRVDGWRQAWIVPAGLGGVATLDFAPNGVYRAGLVLGLVAVIALLALALVRRSREGSVEEGRADEDWLSVEPETGLAGMADVALPILGIGTAVLLGGLPGAAVAVAVLAACRWIPRSYLAFALGLIAAAVAAFIAWPDTLRSSDFWQVTTGLAAIGALVAASGWLPASRRETDGSSVAADAQPQTTKPTPPPPN